MPRLSFPFTSIFNKQPPASTPTSTPPSNTSTKRSSKRGHRRRARSSTDSAPVIKDRESSLYYVCCVSDTATAIPSLQQPYQQHSHSPHCLSPYSHNYHLTLSSSSEDDEIDEKSDIPLVFPSPPPRLSLHFDRRHTDVWDDLFDWAEQYQTTETTSPRLTSATQIDLGTPDSGFRGNKLGFGRFGRSEIWSRSLETPSAMSAAASSAPIVPPRSRLRAPVPAPLNLGPSTSQFLLPVDEPLPQALESTPSLSSGSSDQGSPRQVLLSPELETVVFGRKKKAGAAVGKDPMRIRDGQEVRGSSSGVYTPPTFPGPQGPRPSHFPSHVYTPPTFTLHPTAPRPTPNNYTYTPAGPSRSGSISSGESDQPISPGSSSSRFSTFSGKTMAGFKRISHQIQSKSSSSTSTPNATTPLPQTPHSARDSYFPSTIYNGMSGNSPATPHSRQSSLGPQTPTSATRASQFSLSCSSGTPYGLAVGLNEDQGRTKGLSPEAPGRETSKTHSVLFDHADEGVPKSPQPKGKRKPVPRILDDSLETKMNALEVETHAL